MNIGGIDPGVSGALAVFRNGDLVLCVDLPIVQERSKKRLDLTALATTLRAASLDHVFIELVGAMPKEGPAGAFSFGRTCGGIDGIVAALEIPSTKVTPQSWKRTLRVPAGKDGARARASQLMPSASHHWPLHKHDGRAEAAMIARWGADQLRGIEAEKW